MNLATHFLYFCWALKCNFECQVRLGVFDHLLTILRLIGLKFCGDLWSCLNISHTQKIKIEEALLIRIEFNVLDLDCKSGLLQRGNAAFIKTSPRVLGSCDELKWHYWQCHFLSWLLQKQHSKLQLQSQNSTSFNTYIIKYKGHVLLDFYT